MAGHPLRVLKARAVALAICCAVSAHAAAAATIDVSAGLSLRDALPIVNAAFEARTHRHVSTIYGPSLRLARDIDRGAITDVFITPDQSAMTHLAQRGLVRSDTVVRFIRNQLALVTHTGSTVRNNAPHDIARTLRRAGTIAVTDPTLALSGKFAQLALQNMGLWEVLRPRITITSGVQVTLDNVADGRVNAGITYLSQALRDPRVAVQALLPGNAYPPIVYAMAATENGKGWPEVSAYINFVRSEFARDIFERYGFRR